MNGQTVFINPKKSLSTNRANLAKWILKKRVRTKNFSIFSNNCWAGKVYSDLDLPYMTPFIGLFLNPPCYLRLLKNINNYLEADLSFTNTSQYEDINKLINQGKIRYPIGLLKKDVEIHFQHYSSQSEALEKWNRRLKRIDWVSGNILVEFCPGKPEHDDYFAEFEKLNFPHKVCFTHKNYPAFPSTIWIQKYKNDPFENGVRLYQESKKYFDIADWINGGSGRLDFGQQVMSSILYDN
jgi:uncharacterized protein (DUF1919 family)